MAFAFEELQVYQRALEIAVAVIGGRSGWIRTQKSDKKCSFAKVSLYQGICLDIQL